MRNKTLLFLLLIVPILALATGSPLLYRASYILVFLVLLGFVWSRFGVGGLRAEVYRITPYIQAGQWLEEKVVVRNGSWFPRFMLEVHHETDLPGHSNRRVVHVMSRTSVGWLTRTLCTRRGLFSFGQIRIAAPDPFGLFSFPASLGKAAPLLVYPATLELSDFLLPSGKIMGEGYHQGRTDRSSPDASSVREYVFGDSFGHIHWRTTARTGKLMVKDFDREPAGPSGEVWIVLDMQAAVQSGEGVGSTTEYGVTIGASIAKKYIETNRAVGLMASGDRQYVIPAQRGNQQWGRLQEALALVESKGQAPLNEVVSSSLDRVGPNAVAVLITPAAKDSILATCSLLGEHGVRPVVIVLDAAGFGGRGDASPTITWLASVQVDTYLVRKGEGIEKALDSRLRGAAGKFRPIAPTSR